MRKNDQELMWEAFVENANSGPISTGGPLGGGGSSKKSFGGSSSSSSSDEDDDDTDEEGDDVLKDILDQCCAGDLTADEAYEQVMELMEDEDEGEDEDEDEEGKPGPGFLKRAKKAARRFMGGDANVKRDSRADRYADREFNLKGPVKGSKNKRNSPPRQGRSTEGKIEGVSTKPPSLTKY